MGFQEYLPIAILIIISTGLAVVAVGAGHLFGPRRPTRQKTEPYESGMNPFGPGTRRMPIRFYMVAVLFILFDIEVVFFLPWAVVFKDLGIAGLIEMVIFVAVLVVGFIYAWNKGALEWE
ncbi:MAG: NADH-quinone oxidoreductase subunit A [Anaerolineales bacterium]|nr:NADH-quinone oxidoreductase subunit A [Anaerolineales bacterium]